MANQGDQGGKGGGKDERMGRGVKEGLDGGTSRNAHTSGGGKQGGSGDKGGAGNQGGSGGYGASSGFAGGTESGDDSTEQMETGATEARTRPGNVGRQAESGMETDPEGGQSNTSGGSEKRGDMSGGERGKRERQ